MMTREEEGRGSAAEIIRALKLWLSTAVKAAPLLVTAQCVFAILQAVTAPVQTYGVKLLVDGLTGKPELIGWGIGVILAGFAVMLAGNLLTGPVQDTTGEKVFGRMFAEVLKTTSSIPGIAHHENPKTANRIELMREHAWKLGVSFEVLLFMVATLANTVAVLTLLSTVHPALLLLPLLGSVRIWTAYLSTQWTNNAFEATMPQARLIERLIDIIKNPRHGLELRVFGLRQTMLGKLTDLQTQRAKAEVGAVRRGALIDGAVRIVFGVAYAMAILWVIGRARAGMLTPGDVALVIMVAPQVDQLSGGIAGNMYWLGEVLRAFRRYDWLVQYAKTNSWSQSTEPAPLRLRKGVELKSVTFAYPWSKESPPDGTTAKASVDDRGSAAAAAADDASGATVDEPPEVLRDVSLSFPPGATIALVGENGAGKTTLVKLLSRMYDPTSGAIEVDGVDLRKIDPAQWRRRTSVGFQDFVKFEFLARETVGIGDVDRIEEGPTVRAALGQADAAELVDELPNGLETQLGRKFGDGRDLSGGQWQRLALSRAFMRERPLLLLLDEPTAALDPEAEHALFDRFAAASKQAARETGGITVLVSHRFSTVRMADRIVVMDAGQVVEFGTHAELVASGGRYAELFALQAHAYR